MAHKTLINGTAYKVKNGKTLIGGTSYAIKNGKTLVNSTAYKIPFTYYISGRSKYGETGELGDSGFDETCGYSIINGVRYTSTFNNVPIEAGTQISLKVSASHSDQQYRCYVTLNGKTVQDGAGTYYFTPTNDCTITFIKESAIVNFTWISYWHAEITM